MINDNNFVGLNSGKIFWLLSPKEKEIDIEDIAHSLSLICRFNGHTKHFYSVAQHSLNVSKILKQQGYPSIVQLAGLLHDASEAYVGDLTKPVKILLPAFKDMEIKIQDVVNNKFDIAACIDKFSEEIAMADRKALVMESKNLMKNTMLWGLPIIDENVKISMRRYPNFIIKMKFLRLFKKLRKNLSLCKI